MFHWICPECGREIAPAVKECPACDPHSAAEAEPELVAAGAAYAEALTPEVVLQPRRETRRTTPNAVVITIEADVAVEVEPPPPPPPPEIPAEPPDPLIALLEHVHAGYVGMPLAEPKSAPPASAPQVEEAIAAAPEIVLSEPPAVQARPARSLGGLAKEVPAPSTTEPRAAKPQTGMRGGAGPEAAEAGDAVRPAGVVPEGPHPALAGLAGNAGQAMSRVRAAAGVEGPRQEAVAAQATLPGPTLPHELTSLTGAGISAPLRPREAKPPSRSVPGWLISSLVAGTLLAGAVSAAMYMMPATAAPAPAPKAAPVVAQTPVSPLAKFVEVTGFRHVTSTDRSEIRYLVVNHSAALLNDVTVFVTLRAMNAEAGAPPVTAFSFKMPNLGPWESKEMVSPVERVARAGALPEWREMTAEVEIGQ